MFSPFEELEYLADVLPDEGETILISRESGELVCKPFKNNDLRNGIRDPELYGQLVLANERLHQAAALPIWMTAIGMTWLALAVHGVLQVGLSHWYVIPGIGMPALYGCLQWIRYRQRACFRKLVWPQLIHERQRRHISEHSLIAGVRQHQELRTLLDELVLSTSEAIPSGTSENSGP